ncbi:uncharacterized protein [Montipora foliosa]|uniref:uncharacterized protein n=1 Tax=Montipora foliosa TaxID=591990 RepID=UPI0035F203FB
MVACQKSPICLLNKLIPLLYSEEELANSCGLGIHTTKYLTAFCIQNEKAYPNSKEVNSAFTQQITYARVKAGRKAKTVDMTGL